MDQTTPTPPVLPPPSIPPKPPKPKMTYGIKALYLGLQCFVLLFGTLVVWGLIYSRDERSSTVAEQIADEWGRGVNVYGPYATRSVASDHRYDIMPESFICKANVATESLHRNIYEAEVYNAEINLSGVFNKESIVALKDSAIIVLNVETEQIVVPPTLQMGGKDLKWSSTEDRLYAEVDVSEMPSEIEFSAGFTIRGSGNMNIAQVGDNSEIVISGDASNPSFAGASLPNERTVNDKKFSAEWSKIELTRTLAASASAYPPAYEDSDFRESVGVEFLVGVDRYQKVTRSLKYSLFIILLTYISVFFIEMTTKRTIPLLNYFLIGVALIIFYTLLLSFSEHLEFGVSYLIASAMTVILITTYMWEMLESKKISIAIAVILTVLYSSCYVLMTLAKYSLLLGSLLLFAVLAAMMLGSLKIKSTENTK